MSLLLYKVTDLVVSIRVRPEDEAAGLDISQHAEWLALVPAPGDTGAGSGRAGGSGAGDSGAGRGARAV
jgi:hypothetical protein